MKQFERKGELKGSFEWNRGRRNRPDDAGAEDWIHDKE